MSKNNEGVSKELKSFVGGLKIVLEYSFFIGIIVTIGLPFLLKYFGVNMILAISIVYPNGFLLLMITKNFIKLFDSIKQNNPFCKENVKLLVDTGIISAWQSVCWVFSFIMWIMLAKSLDIVEGLIIVFLFILFMGVAFALFILGELLDKAVDYKKENELTI